MTEVTFRSDSSVDLIQHAGSDAIVAAAARVSTRGTVDAPNAGADHAGLIRYLMAHRHGSPFEHGLLTFRVETPLFVVQQILRHRAGFSFNQESGRYRRLDPVFWRPDGDRKLAKPEHHKAARPVFDAATQGQMVTILHHDTILRELYAAYERELGEGIADEVARRLLPVTTYTSLYVTCNPRSLMHFLSLRTHRDGAKFVSYPQREIEQVANQMEAIFATHWPLTHQAFSDAGRVAP